MLKLATSLDQMSEREYALTCRIDELERAFREPVVFPPSLRITATESRILRALLKRDLLSHEQMGIIAAQTHLDEASRPDLTKVYISHIRTKLRPHGVQIQTVWGVGYHMTPEHKARLRALCEDMGLAA